MLKLVRTKNYFFIFYVFVQHTLNFDLNDQKPPLVMFEIGPVWENPFPIENRHELDGLDCGAP